MTDIPKEVIEEARDFAFRFRGCGCDECAEAVARFALTRDKQSTDQAEVEAPVSFTPEDIVAILKTWTRERRMEVLCDFCSSCGRDNPYCQCWNDE